LAKIGKYELVRQLATGGMAEIFLAKTEGPLGFEKMVVVKRISPPLLGDPQFLEMFLQEAKLAAQLDHPNIAQVFDFGESGGDYFLAMEYVDGPNLRTLSTQAHKAGKPIPFPLCTKIVSYACEGLAFAHEYASPKTNRPMNIVHRDVSPDNIVLAKNGSVKVVDFGIAKAAEQLYQTQSGYRKGKLAYMAPEYLRGHAPDRRSDVYALGVVLYELLSNWKPYDAENEIALMHAMIYEAIVPLRERRHDVPEELERIVSRTLGRDPGTRYQSCRELHAALERYMVSVGEPLSSVHISKIIAGLQPELDVAATAAKTPNRKLTPSGKTPPKKASGNGEKRKGATPPKPITFQDLEPEERTVEMNGPAMVANAIAVGGGGTSNEATQNLTTQDLAAAGVVTRKIEPAPAPKPSPSPELQPVAEPEEEEPTQERTNPALSVRPMLSPKPPRRAEPKRAERAREPPPSPAALVLTQKQLVAMVVAALALMLFGVGTAVLVMGRSSAEPPRTLAVAPSVVPPAPPKPAPMPLPVELTPEPVKPPPPPRTIGLEVLPNVPVIVKIGKTRVRTPPYWFELRPGTYDIEVDDPGTGRAMKHQEVEVKAGELVRKVRVEIGQGTAIFTTVPVIDAAVYVDNEPHLRCNTPCEVLLSEGPHRAKFVSSKQPEPDELQFTVPAGKSVGVVASFL